MRDFPTDSLLSDITPDKPTPTALVMPGGPHGVVLFHGLYSTPMELKFVARGLQRAGYSVHLPVLPGYTYGLPPTPSQKTSAQAWVAMALQAVDACLPQYQQLSVGGLCMGAVLALQVAAQHSPQLSALLALSTTLHFDGWAIPWYGRLLPLAPYLPGAQAIAIHERNPYGVKDIRIRAWIQQQMQNLRQSDAGAAALPVRVLLLARDLMAQAQRSLAQIHCDTLLIHAKDDECSSPRSAFEVAQSISATRTELVLLSDSYHMISLDQEKLRVIAAMTRFLAAVPSRLASCAFSTETQPVAAIE